MAIEKERRCGFRKVGGLYLVSDALGETCHRLPFALTVCPTCGAGVKQQRSWAWVNGQKLLDPLYGCEAVAAGRTGVEPHGLKDPRAELNSDLPYAADRYYAHCVRCPICSTHLLGERCGLLWVGEKFYPTPLDFVTECYALGLSKRLAHVPKGLELGKTWVLLAHPSACPVPFDQSGVMGGGPGWVPGIFKAFIPTRLEMLVSKSMATPNFLADLDRRGITPVIVPDDDPDHNQGGIADDADNGALPLGDT